MTQLKKTVIFDDFYLKVILIEAADFPGTVLIPFIKKGTKHGNRDSIGMLI
jgi:hypothetical protein